MPEFILNRDNRGSHPFYALDDFAKGYVEAMFFTNGDTGDDDDNRLNDLGVERLTRAAVAEIESDCVAFQRDNAADLAAVYAMEPGPYGKGQRIDEIRAGHLFWFARQGHGVDWTDWYAPAADVAELERLQEASSAFGESYVEISRGWIYVR